MEFKEWVYEHNLQEALRVAVDNLNQTHDYEPFEHLMVDGTATVLVKIDDKNNVSFNKIETSPTLTEASTLEEPKKEVVQEETVEVKPAPRRTRRETT